MASANDDLVNLPAKLPVNRDGFGLLASGDLLPDIGAEGAQGNLWERLRRVPFLRVFKPEEKDTQLDAKLAAEAEGILTFLVEGARRAAVGGDPATPECVRSATEAYQKESDLLGEFMEEVTQPVVGATCLKTDLHDAYCRWALPWTLTTLTNGSEHAGLLTSVRVLAWTGPTSPYGPNTSKKAGPCSSVYENLNLSTRKVFFIGQFRIWFIELHCPCKN